MSDLAYAQPQLPASGNVGRARGVAGEQAVGTFLLQAATVLASGHSAPTVPPQVAVTFRNSKRMRSTQSSQDCGAPACSHRAAPQQRTERQQLVLRPPSIGVASLRPSPHQQHVKTSSQTTSCDAEDDLFSLISGEAACRATCPAPPSNEKFLSQLDTASRTSTTVPPDAAPATSSVVPHQMRSAWTQTRSLMFSATSAALEMAAPLHDDEQLASHLLPPGRHFVAASSQTDSFDNLRTDLSELLSTLQAFLSDR